MIVAMGVDAVETVKCINDMIYYSSLKLSQRSHAKVHKLLKKLGVKTTNSNNKSMVVSEKGTIWLGDYVIFNAHNNEFTEIVSTPTFEVRYR